MHIGVSYSCKQLSSIDLYWMQLLIALYTQALIEVSTCIILMDFQ